MGRRNETLRELWDGYARAGYEKVDLTHSTKQLRKVMEQLFLPCNGEVVLDAGCGTGGMFETTIRRIRPAELWAVDWSEEMLKKAQIEAEKLRDQSNIHFEFRQLDLTTPLFWPAATFDGIVSNIVVCYLRGGWQEPIRELHRVLKPGRHLYLSTFLKEWENFPTALSRFALAEIIRAPIGVLYGIRFRKIAAEIAEEAKKQGAEFPSRDELIDFLEVLGFEEIKVLPVYWGFGLALRARKS